MGGEQAQLTPRVRPGCSRPRGSLTEGSVKR